MNEVVLVEFLIPATKSEEYMSYIDTYSSDPHFKKVTSSSEFEIDEDDNIYDYVRVSYKMTSESASAIRLSHAAGDLMRISYIPDSLKDKYRTK